MMLTAIPTILPVIQIPANVPGNAADETNVVGYLTLIRETNLEFQAAGSTWLDQAIDYFALLPSKM